MEAPGTAQESCMEGWGWGGGGDWEEAYGVASCAASSGPDAVGPLWRWAGAYVLAELWLCVPRQGWPGLSRPSRILGMG
eukprot:365033-Chlamydomonas_euryale.AAC.5